MVDDLWPRRMQRQLRPEAVRANLVRAGAVLAAHQVLRGQIVGRLRGFFSFSGESEGSEGLGLYQSEVLSRARSEVSACLDWLVESGPLSSEDAAMANRLREERNRVAHELPKALIDPAFPVNETIVQDAARVSQAIARFWALTWATANPAFDNREIDPTAVESGASLLIAYLGQLAGPQDDVIR